MDRGFVGGDGLFGLSPRRAVSGRSVMVRVAALPSVSVMVRVMVFLTLGDQSQHQ